MASRSDKHGRGFDLKEAVIGFNRYILWAIVPLEAEAVDSRGMVYP